jgi:hypothetical protein
MKPNCARKCVVCKGPYLDILFASFVKQPYLDVSRNENVEKIVGYERNSKSKEVIFNDTKDVNFETSIVWKMRIFAIQCGDGPIGKTFHC